MKFLVLLIFSLLSASAATTTWYVDNAASGSAIGTSWANAFTNLDQAVRSNGLMGAGHTLYISGGSSSKTYSNQLWYSVSGTAGNPFTFSIGQDAGHTGKAIIDGSNNGTNRCTNGMQFGHFNTITGDNGTGSTNLLFRNFMPSTNGANRDTGCALAIDTAAGCIAHHVEVQDCNNGIRVSTGTNEVIYNCWVHDIWGDVCIRWGADFDTTNFESVVISNCTVTGNRDITGVLGGPDAFTGANGVTIHHCIARSVSGSVSAGQHPDGVQLDGSYHKIFDNYFANFANAGWKPNPITRAKWVESYFFNNIITLDDSSALTYATVDYKGTEPGWTTNPLGITNVVIAHNLFVDLPFYALVGGAFSYQTCSGFYHVNNLIYNCGGKVTGTPKYCAIDQGTNLLLMDFNLLIAGVAGYTNIASYNDAQTIPTTMLQTHGMSGSITFQSYTTNNINNNFHYTPTVAGTNISGLFPWIGIDKDGVTRSANVVGPFETAGSITTNMTINIARTNFVGYLQFFGPQ